MLITLYTLVVLKDLGLDPASKQACKMIGRVDKRLVFKPLNNRPPANWHSERITRHPEAIQLAQNAVAGSVRQAGLQTAYDTISRAGVRMLEADQTVV